jgi:DNA-directed RNA polymerase specialized sigma24 family protein
MPIPTSATEGVPGPDTRELAIEQEQALIEQCLRGHRTAWSHLFARYHPVLLQAVQTALAERGSDRELIEEIAARVWYSLTNDEGRTLARFDAGRRRRLASYLFAIARNAVYHYFREERRRQGRERAAYGSGECRLNGRDAASGNLLLEEFESQLSPRELQFLRLQLLGPDESPVDGKLSPSNMWQLNHRIRSKFAQFISSD